MVKVDRLEVPLEVEDLAHDQHRDDQRGDSREDRADHEVRSEDRAVPHGLERHGEHERHHGVHGNSDRDHENRHDPDAPLEHRHLPLAASPPEGEDLVEPPHAFAHDVAKDGDVGNHGQPEVDRARREVGGDAGRVPQQRRLVAAELQEVEHPVGTTQVNEDVRRADGQHHDRDHLGHPGDRPPPLRVADPENR